MKIKILFTILFLIIINAIGAQYSQMPNERGIIDSINQCYQYLNKPVPSNFLQVDDDFYLSPSRLFANALSPIYVILSGKINEES